MVEIMLQFFIYVFDNPRLWPQVLPRIQGIINNTFSSLIRKIPNKVTYGFSLRCLLDFATALPILDTLVTYVDVVDTISFALFNQKMIYNYWHQLLFRKIGKWAMLQLHKEYSIPAIAEIIKKLT